MKPVKRKRQADSPPVVLTIGHSTRALAEFIGLLRAHGATCVVDVRTVPRSRHNPQFNQATLPRALKKAGVGYVHLPGLGGRRHAKRDSINVGWRNASFRGYADHMQTREFAESLDELIRRARRDRIALMCAEAVPWRCHRSLIADALLVHGIRTEDIMSLTRRQVHRLTPFAKVRGTTITYPAEGSPISPAQPRTAEGKIMKPKKKFNLAEAHALGAQLGIDWNEVRPDEFHRGLAVELEHGSRDPETDVTHDDPRLTGKIAWAHLKEFPDYYTRLDKLEAAADRFWTAKRRRLPVPVKKRAGG